VISRRSVSAFLERHGELLRIVKPWTIRLLVPKHLSRVAPRYHAAFREQLATPLRPANVDDLRWYFRARQSGRREHDPERFDQAMRAFAAPRFRALHRAWRQRGEPELDAIRCMEPSAPRVERVFRGISASPSREGKKHLSQSLGCCYAELTSLSGLLGPAIRIDVVVAA
jgi:hypothetical protein